MSPLLLLCYLWLVQLHCASCFSHLVLYNHVGKSLSFEKDHMTKPTPSVHIMVHWLGVTIIFKKLYSEKCLHWCLIRWLGDDYSSTHQSVIPHFSRQWVNVWILFNSECIYFNHVFHKSGNKCRFYGVTVPMWNRCKLKLHWLASLCNFSLWLESHNKTKSMKNNVVSKQPCICHLKGWLFVFSFLFPRYRDLTLTHQVQTLIGWAISVPKTHVQIPLSVILMNRQFQPLFGP